MSRLIEVDFSARICDFNGDALFSDVKPERQTLAYCLIRFILQPITDKEHLSLIMMWMGDLRIAREKEKPLKLSLNKGEYEIMTKIVEDSPVGMVIKGQVLECMKAAKEASKQEATETDPKKAE